MSYGVPEEWLDEVHSADEHTILSVSEHLPAEAAEDSALLTVTLSHCIPSLMDREFSIQELADVVNGWCAGHDIEPASGQAGKAVTERNIRYYRTIGLLDAPADGGGHGFGKNIGCN